MHGDTLVKLILSFTVLLAADGGLDDLLVLSILEALHAYAHWWHFVRPGRHHSPKHRLTFRKISPYECWAFVRFKKEDIKMFNDAESLECPNGSKQKQDIFLGSHDASFHFNDQICGAVKS